MKNMGLRIGEKIKKAREDPTEEVAFQGNNVIHCLEGERPSSGHNRQHKSREEEGTKMDLQRSDTEGPGPSKRGELCQTAGERNLRPGSGKTATQSNKY